jgi:hypothetical protein
MGAYSVSPEAVDWAKDMLASKEPQTKVTTETNGLHILQNL